LEDRDTPALYLEMTDLAADAYVEKRVPELANTPGAKRVTWWANCLLNRKDLPRTLPEFQLLGLVEADLTYEPPPVSAEVRGHLFHRTPRPGQGTISPRPTLGLELVLISPDVPERAQELRDWGDFVHIRDIAAASPPHFTMITPYVNARAEAPKFMHFYELDTDDPEPAFRQMTPVTRRHQGAYGTHDDETWFMHPALVIDYVNTFRLLGETKVG